MNTELLVAVDVGGTHSRLRAVLNDRSKIQRISPLFKQKVASKQELKNFITASVREFCSGAKIAKVVIGFAGAVIENNEVKMTNWLDRPRLKKSDMISWGFPKEKTLMVNDMELAAYGVMQMVEQNSREFITLYEPKQKAEMNCGNKLVIAPGTGFGTTTILDVESLRGKHIQSVLPSEIQHIQVPALDEEHAGILDIIEQKYPAKKYLSYEDFVSGTGLRDTYLALAQQSGSNISQKITTAEIACAACDGNDEIAVRSLELFYRLVGRLIQAMALSLQPYGGIYLCGSSTLANKDFILESSFLQELHNCKVRKELLGQFPVFLVTKPEIHVSGGLWACEKFWDDK